MLCTFLQFIASEIKMLVITPGSLTGDKKNRRLIKKPPVCYSANLFNVSPAILYAVQSLIGSAPSDR